MIERCSGFNNTSKAGLLLAALMCSTVIAGPAMALTLEDPSQIEKRYEGRPEPKATHEPVVENQTQPSTSTAQNIRRFTLKDLRIEGATVYSADQLRPYYVDYVGKEISLTELNAIAAAITARYQQDGYLLSSARLPSQMISGGVARVQVVEGSVGNISIEGEHVESNWRNLVQSFAEKIKADRPLRAKTMERYLLLIDDLPGVTAKGVVRPTSDPATSDLVVVMKHKKYEASLNANNRGTRFIGPLQYQATATGNSLLGLYDRTVARVITTSPTTELRFFDIQHEEQIGHEGTKIVATAGWTHTEPAYLLTPLDLEGDSQSFNISVQHPFIRSRKENLNGRATFNSRHTHTDVFGSTDLNNDRLNVLRVGGAYDIADKLNGVNLFDAEVSQGLDIWGATDADPFRSRADGRSNFTKMTLDVARLQALPANFSILAAATAQYSFDPLLASEEFTLGGPSFGQAYDPSEITGDSGAAAKLELRYGREVGHQYFRNYQAYTFYDIGKTWEKDFPPGVKDEQSMASAGLGLRLNLTDWISGEGQVAFPLTKNVAIENDDDPRFFFNLTARF